jgi:recombinational DNA repair ATPase RecF
VSGFTDGSREIAAFYQQYSAGIYVLDAIVWFTLSITGILPGTAKHRRSFIDHSVAAE